MMFCTDDNSTSVKYDSKIEITAPKSVSTISIYFILLQTFRATLRWRHNGSNGVSDHQPQDCLLSRFFRRRSKETSKLRVTGFCAGNSPVTGEFPVQRASNAENVSNWWRHRELKVYTVHRPLIVLTQEHKGNTADSSHPSRSYRLYSNIHCRPHRVLQSRHLNKQPGVCGETKVVMWGCARIPGALLLTWINLNPCMDM